MAAPSTYSLVERRAMRHHAPTCICATCERTGNGDFAVRAYADGDGRALTLLSDEVAAVLPSLIVEADEAGSVTACSLIRVRERGRAS